jgi:hypothetical protein
MVYLKNYLTYRVCVNITPAQFFSAPLYLGYSPSSIANPKLIEMVWQRQTPRSAYDVLISKPL